LAAATRRSKLAPSAVTETRALELNKGGLRGKITFDGTAGEPPFHLAVNGGTGDFRRARGQARLYPIRDDAFRIDLQLFLQ
jgi:hypothetical protein